MNNGALSISHAVLMSIDYLTRGETHRVIRALTYYYVFLLSLHLRAGDAFNNLVASQHAGDTLFYLQRLSEAVLELLTYVAEYIDAAGIKLNRSKYILFPLSGLTGRPREHLLDLELRGNLTVLDTYG
ncbi:hypothetical protein NDU88_004787 [Pleurodeles waltl]|uniref:Uncharacterized protein n=1 Tax=Pleurodeles waltl TaxID=8319 RepID=A0AAV7SJT5_PLEWA|nr:hypothetical protein NDU88_004787 [Pleurodeles waltl]